MLEQLLHLKSWLLQIQVGCIKILRTNVARFVLTKCWANGGMHVSGGKEPIFPDRPQPPRPQLTPSPLPGSAPSRRWKNWRFVFITSLGFSLNLSVSRITSHIYFGLGKTCIYILQPNQHIGPKKKVRVPQAQHKLTKGWSSIQWASKILALLCSGLFQECATDLVLWIFLLKHWPQSSWK